MIVFDIESDAIQIVEHHIVQSVVFHALVGEAAGAGPQAAGSRGPFANAALTT
jgi:hypothetical protein